MPAIAVQKVSITGPIGPGVAPPGKILAGMPNVFASGAPVAYEGSPISPHGNYTKPDAPGYNPLCQNAFIEAVPTTRVFVNGLPVATVGSLCNCYYHNIVLGVANINVGEA